MPLRFPARKVIAVEESYWESNWERKMSLNCWSKLKHILYAIGN